MHKTFSWVLAALMACGGKATVDEGSGGASTSSSGTSSSGTSSSGTSSSGTSSSTGSSGTSSSSSGAGGGYMACSDYEDAYPSYLVEALACDPALDAEQCTLEMPGDLECQCPVFVNPANEGEINALNAFLSGYASLGCDPGIECKCADAKSGSCQPDPAGGGKCVTTY